MADDWARWSGEYRLTTGKSLAKLPLAGLYEVAVAQIARQAEKSGEVQESVERTLRQLNPPPKVEQTRRADGVLEHNPDMVIPGWGVMDDDDMPDMPQITLPDPLPTASDGELPWAD